MITVKNSGGKIVKTYGDDDFKNLSSGELLEDFPEIDQRKWYIETYADSEGDIMNVSMGENWLLKKIWFIECCLTHGYTIEGKRK